MVINANSIPCGYSIYKNVGGAGVPKSTNRDSTFALTPRLATGTKTSVGMGAVGLMLSNYLSFNFFSNNM